MQPLPGFRDFYPEDLAFREAILCRWRTMARRYGFVEYDGPVLEPLELYRKKSGAEILDQVYQFTDRGGRLVAMRPEITPTLARMVRARHRDYRKPLKWFSIPQVYRYERAQRGRLREHFQWNCDILGEESREADIEVVALLIDLLRSFGLGAEDFVVRVSDRGFWARFFERHQVREEQRYGIFQAIDKIERQPREKTEEALGPLAAPIFRLIDEGEPWEPVDRILAGLGARGLSAFAELDYRVVRGLAYYTGTVFEAFDRQGAFRAIAGGGRYDDLLERLGGEPMPAVGFGMGDVVLGELLRAKGKLQAALPRPEVFVVISEEEIRPAAVRLVHSLREEGFSVDYPLHAAKPKKQWERAEAVGARHALLADFRLMEGKVEVREMVSRRSRVVSLEAIGALLKTGARESEWGGESPPLGSPGEKGLE
ncbi:histidyl-tRNA synthetase [Methylacidimicrobium cyclopophantes]|uniref:Histidine--tRNA ligase n=1 Tax=Methylacidimicrobium cyclopophantes TaxID=1041766 RepID=A0A5E6MJB5_9BACT|nr:histidine--tRNA ligase [Methylacidimicrobium cyclopophantes]VVM06157.1 histidyl-tRNA synthetase [Methylacidimicrobium cyclopophantes]